ncbi:hypothetical protein [Novosphingobium terrae]|uniref:hypothetical protein n=1 Tax=Novosphingobium terrae TaxID=2726189 RepID=UPI0019802A29|nr:hypothetical protein [Novosphingobium terrae]
MSASLSRSGETRSGLLPFYGNGSHCTHCADGTHADDALRMHVLNLLALIEHEDALPKEAALRIARELLAWCNAPEPAQESANLNQVA